MADSKITQTRDQQRAQFAWKFVEKDLGGLGPKDFAIACKNASARILNAGLGGALAFSIAKGKESSKTVDMKYLRVSQALAGFLGNDPRQKEEPRAFLEWLIGQDAMVLRAKTDEAIAVLEWLARVADGKANAIGDEGSRDD